jgi:4-amino-4-deoxy-L-arabinose transferase-like glycosyltransferase
MRGRGDARFAWALVAIAVLGAAIRVAYVFSQQIHTPLTGDPYVFTIGAQGLARGLGWVDPYTGFSPRPTASHPPLYTLWLWIPAYLGDGHRLTQLTAMLWSCIPGTGTVVLLGLAGKEMIGRRYGLIAAALAAVYPGLWVYDGLLLSETVAMFAVAGVILFAYRFWNHPSPARVAWLGAWCGLAALSRSELILTFPLVLLPVVLSTKRRRFPVRLRWLAMAAAVGVAVISPWLIFNAGRFHHRVLMTTSAGRTMAAANCDETYYGPNVGLKAYPCLQAAFDRHPGAHWDESDRDRQFGGDAREYMKDHLARVPVVIAARWARILQLLDPRREVEQNQYYRVNGRVGTELQFFSFYVIVGLAAVGAFVLRRRRVAVFPLLAFPVIALIAVATTFAQWRYRATAEPALVMLAAATLLAALRQYESRRAGRRVGDSVSRT